MLRVLRCNDVSKHCAALGQERPICGIPAMSASHPKDGVIGRRVMDS
jgi:hypothetical protein